MISTISWVMLNFIRTHDRRLMKAKEFAIVSNNCWGGEIYKWLGHKFNTPFIGLFMYAPCYVRFLKDLQKNLVAPLNFVNQSKYTSGNIEYPIGTINGMEIHFVHYASPEEAKEKWNRRAVRLLRQLMKGPVFFKMCDRDLASETLLKEFHALPFKNKLSFGTKPIEGLNNHIKIKSQAAFVPDGVILHKLSYRHCNLMNWISGKDSIPDPISTFKAKLLERTIN